jgi:GNAT superfamily N-acetyltransferase
MSAVEIRIATAEDLLGLVDALTSLFAEDPGTRDPTVSQEWPVRFGLSNMTAWIADGNRLVLAAADGEAVVGLLTGIITEPADHRPVRVATLHSLYVDPAHRNDGVGARLVETFRSWARQRRADRMSVTAYAANIDAIRFYQRHGFTALKLELDGEP